MPICIPDALPARKTLESENIFVMPEGRASCQDIRPLHIAILNLMPTKVVTETQLLRCLSNTPLQIVIDLVQTSTYTSKNTPGDHLLSFYKTFDQICGRRYDGLIVTGAPVEHLPFEKVQYWPELCDILDWARHHVHSSFFICWGAQAALYHYYGIPKYPLPEKMFGVFSHERCCPSSPLFRGMDDILLAPHSRHTATRAEDVAAVSELEVLSTSPEAGLYIAGRRDGRQFFVTGHSEYDAGTLATEYRRDIDKGLSLDVPRHYFPNDDPAQRPPKVWRSHAALLYANWLNYYVYQTTPYDLDEIG